MTHRNIDKPFRLAEDIIKHGACNHSGEGVPLTGVAALQQVEAIRTRWTELSRASTWGSLSACIQGNLTTARER